MPATSAMNTSPAVLIRGVLSAALLSLFAGCSTTTVTSGRHIPGGTAVAVLPFENLSNHRHAGLILTDLATTILHVSPRFDVREVSDPGLGEDVRLRRLETDPWERQVGVNTAAAAEVGAALDVGHVLAGSVGEYGFVDGFGETANVGVTLRLVKVETGEVVWAGSLSRKAATTAFNEESVHRLAHQVLVELLERMDAELMPGE
jgi:TolB-like protein